MICKSFQDMKLSALGFGCMRLPVIKGDYSAIDQAAVDEMISYAMDKGVNYYDTAYGYHDGYSERALGKSLKRFPRDKWYIADKFPGYDLANMDRIEQIFEEQLERCGVDYFDFYLFHNVCEMNIDAYLDEEKYNLFGFLTKQKKAGRIKHLGFSAHGSYDVMKRFLDAYGSDMEFCQIQLNYLDWEFQGAKKKVELLREHSIPIWVMEPVRGGKLAKLGNDSDKLKALRPDETIPAWAFRFIQGVEGVCVTLSGMSDMEQVKDNISTFETEKPLNETELKVLSEIVDGMIKADSLPCTKCRYCTSHCPKGLDIPALLELYNEHKLTGGGFIAPMALMTYAEDKKPSACIGCRSCEAVCPQQIKVSEAMKDFSEMLNG